MRSAIMPVLLAATMPAVWACDSERQPAGASASEVRAATPRPVATVVAPGECDLIPAHEIQRLLGPIEGRPEPKEHGCWYYFATDSSTEAWAQNREWEQRMGASGADPRTIRLYGNRRPGLFVDVDVTGAPLAQASRSGDSGRTEQLTGWDQVSFGRGRFSGRTGHVTIRINLQELRLPADTLAAMAARVRDRIPDGPFPHPNAAAARLPAPGPDPCSVLTRSEAEPVIGKLLVPPFRTRERTALADPAGSSCGYLSSGHHVLVLTPEWTYGRTALDAERMVGGLVRQVAELPGINADTLEGSWDDAEVGVSGELVLLKGPRALSIGYLLSSTDAAGAIRLAEPALARLAAAP
jgi:hypothetical protein